jgi:ribosomal protein L7/L12
MDTPRIRPEVVDSLLNNLIKGFKIEAIKDYRTITGCDLRESNDAVERVMPAIYREGYTAAGVKAALREIRNA